MKVYDTLHEAYLGSLEDVYFNYEYKASPRGQAVREITDYTFRVTNPKPDPIITRDAERNKIIEKYTKKEVELYNSCTNDVKEFAKASKFWNKIANSDGTVNSAYGHLIWQKKSLGNDAYEAVSRTPWEWCVESLRADKDTRQALLRFSLPEHHYMGNKDFVCTLGGNFLIRDNKLNLSIVMRSNDLTLGLTYDLPWFISLMYKMIDELKDAYPDLEVGHYTHTAHSMHIYERDEEKVLKMLGR
ncbi:MAG: hypothetical protein HWN81_00095 [Candidatus Lokiarchaeota archaeon]|nr:hypothetical protein [Candidatus Lokiarchaeota archaeon]